MVIPSSSGLCARARAKKLLRGGLTHLAWRFFFLFVLFSNNSPITASRLPKLVDC